MIDCPPNRILTAVFGSIHRICHRPSHSHARRRSGPVTARGARAAAAPTKHAHQMFDRGRTDAADPTPTRGSGRSLRIQRRSFQLRNCLPSVADSQMPYVPWYRRKDYKHIRSIMDDVDQFPETFDEWEKTAKRRLASAAAAGVSIQPVMLDAGEFLAYCKAKNLSARGDHERNMFARASALNLKKAESDQLR
jgi:hypothetical protein